MIIRANTLSEDFCLKPAGIIDNADRFIIYLRPLKILCGGVAATFARDRAPNGLREAPRASKDASA